MHGIIQPLSALQTLHYDLARFEQGGLKKPDTSSLVS